MKTKANVHVLPCRQRCPKCGSTDILREFREKGHQREEPTTHSLGDTDKRNAFERTITKDFYSKLVAIAAHIHNHCRCCHFSWGAKPLATASRRSAGARGETPANAKAVALSPNPSP